MLAVGLGRTVGTRERRTPLPASSSAQPDTLARAIFPVVRFLPDIDRRLNTPENTRARQDFFWHTPTIQLSDLCSPRGGKVCNRVVRGLGYHRDLSPVIVR